jgi:hypothetical protein
MRPLLTAFSGSLPYGIGSIPSLSQISLSNNLLSGRIFAAVLTRELNALNIANNFFTDSIADSIFIYLLSLVAVLASGNGLFGSIPKTVCNVADNNMTIFDFSNSGSYSLCPDNQRIQSNRSPLVHGAFSRLGLSGTILSCLLASSSMTALRLSGNRWHGSLPPSISSSSLKLLILTLAYNSLAGSIPDWI